MLPSSICITRAEQCSTQHTQSLKHHIMQGIMYRFVRVLLCNRHFAFFIDCPLSVLLCVFFANYNSTSDQNVASPANTPHTTGQSALHKWLLALLNRWLHQSWAPFVCPLRFLLYISLRERSGRRFLYDTPNSAPTYCLYCRPVKSATTENRSEWNTQRRRVLRCVRGSEQKNKK